MVSEETLASLKMMVVSWSGAEQRRQYDKAAGYLKRTLIS